MKSTFSNHLRVIREQVKSCLMIVYLSGLVLGQQPANQEPVDVVRVNTNLVQLRIVVTDKSGKPIEGLKQDDFDVLENNQPQKISLFSFEHSSQTASVTGEDGKPAPTESRSSSPVPVPLVTRSIVLFVDSLHTSNVSLMRAKKQLKQFVDQQVTDQDLVAVVSTSGSQGLLGQFMRDRVRLKNAIDRVSRLAGPTSFFTPYLAAKVLEEAPGALAVGTRILIQEEGDPLVPPPAAEVRGRAQEILAYGSFTRKATFQMLKAVAERLAELPGQRMIALVSDGFTLLDRGGGEDHQDFEDATSRAIKSGVVVYSFSAEGLMTPVEATAQVSSGLADFKDSNFSRYMNDTRTDQQNTLRYLAGDTGGEAFLNSNDLAGQLKRMLDANQVYYAIGYYPPGETNKKFRNIKVRVKDHPDYQIRTQRGYQPFAETVEKPAATPQERLLRGMMEPLPITGIPIASSVGFLRRASDDAQVTLQVLIDGNPLKYITQQDRYQLKCDVTIVLLDDKGKITKTLAERLTTTLTATQLDNAKARGFRHTQRLEIPPGLYQVRVGVRDVNGEAMGTSMSWVEVPKLQKNKLALSSVFLGKERGSFGSNSTEGQSSKSPPTLVVGQAAFKNSEPVFYRFVVYTASPSANLSYRVEVLKEDKTIFDGNWQPLEPRIMARDAIGLEIGGQLKMEIDPGIYTLRVTVKDSTKQQSAQQTIELELVS